MACISRRVAGAGVSTVGKRIQANEIAADTAWMAAWSLLVDGQVTVLRYDTIEEINVDSKAEYTA